MANSQPQPIPLTQADAWQSILPRSPILSSATATWQGIHLEYHRQPAHETPDYCFPSHLISIGLGYEAKEFRVSVEVCHQVGFQSQSHFTHVFRKHTNVTPKAYRNLL